nr:MAG TPA_asm: hypothetical protein [Caudoviricetes sp.]
MAAVFAIEYSLGNLRVSYCPCLYSTPVSAWNSAVKISPSAIFWSLFHSAQILTFNVFSNVPSSLKRMKCSSG